MNTQLLYLDQMELFTAEATVLEIIEQNEKQIIILDQTIFYPQGGGQPYDTGKMISDDAEFAVQEVRKVGENIHHIGKFLKGRFEIGQKVTMHINQERRYFHSQLHSAGHLIDNAVVQLGLSWQAGKAYHFPEGPYIEYGGTFDPNQGEILCQQIEAAVNEMIREGFPTKAYWIERPELNNHCLMPLNDFPHISPVRIVTVYGERGYPCGGTHVHDIKELPYVKVPKIKGSKGVLRVSYVLEREAEGKEGLVRG
jgi:Ser-tRNA(Ala) deacylase AlaX